MFRAILLSFVGLYFQNQPKIITIDITQIGQLELSSIVEKVIPIPLNTNKFSFPNIDKVFLTDEHVYVLNHGRDSLLVGLMSLVK